MPKLLNRPTLKQRPSIRLKQRLEILSLPRWRLLANTLEYIHSNDGGMNSFEWVALEKSREAKLLEEMRFNHGYNHQQETILSELIGNLNEYGFLADSPATIATRLQIPENEIQCVRHDLRNFENSGVGSLHFVEFLLFQLSLIIEERENQIPRKIFQLFSKVQRSGQAMGFIQVIRRVHRQLDEECLNYLRSGVVKMTPWPADDETIKCSALPDVYASIVGGTLKVNVPRDFSDSLAFGVLAPERKNFYALRMAIALRESTLQRVCEQIFTHQMPFLLHGIQAIGSMTQKKISEELALAPSTVSRTLANKYVHTPHGSFPLADFLPGDLSTSRLYIGHLMKCIVEKSWRNILLSDQKMADLIWKNFGVKVSRRFVARIRRIPYEKFKRRG
ncbi:MAG: hypothetical protein LBI34_00015 [Puniceicoccales bacterium]|jgi:RNA polymerase sigma-54 factor|nr:hypothetical protein [Puniceicoccales bacterium]